MIEEELLSDRKRSRFQAGKDVQSAGRGEAGEREMMQEESHRLIPATTIRRDGEDRA